MKRSLLLAMTIFVLAAGSPRAAQFLVTNTDDRGAGSLRDAIDQANVGSDMDTIYFNILGGRGPYVINDSGLLVLNPALIDGYSQSGAIQNTNGADQPWNGTIMVELNGDGIPGQHLLTLGFPSSEVRGLALTGAEGGYAVWLAINGGHKVAGCFVGLDPSGASGPDQLNGLGGVFAESDNNDIGSTNSADRNVISGNWAANIEIVGNGNLVRGNIIGLAPDGVTQINRPSVGNGVEVTGDNNIIGGNVGGGRNIISDNPSWAIVVVGGGNVIRRNRIGTDVTGTIGRGSDWGISISGGDGNSIGARQSGARNQICNHRSYGISVGSTATNTIIRGNNIGVGVGGVPLGNGTHGAAYGIQVHGNGTQIGGGLNNQGNHIANNKWGGISVDQAAVGVTIRRNQIYSNNDNNSEFWDGLDIDLADDGVTANDPLDADAGPNSLQNFPVITDVNIFTGNLDIAGTVDSEPNMTYTVELFANSFCHAEGYGGGETYLGVTTATTNGSGTGTFAVSLPLTVVEGDFITATATAPDGSTSEFSACVEVLSPFLVINGNDNGYGTLRRAIENANSNPGNDHIEFIRPFPGFVEPVTPLPDVTETATIGHFGPGVPETGRISGALLSPGTEALVLTAADCRVTDVEFYNFSNANVVRVTGFSGQVDNCKFIDNNNCVAISVTGDDAFIIKNEILSGHSYGIILDGNDARVRENEIYQCAFSGVWCRGTAANNEINNNCIGGSGGNGNGGYGVLLASSNPNIAGRELGVSSPNTISYNTLGGIGVINGSGNWMLGNSIFDNGGLAIDLGGDGVTNNDSGDGDIGPNNLLNFPVLSGAYLSACGMTVCGTYSSTPSTTFTLEFFSSPACDGSNYGEGQTYLGTVDVTTSPLGSVQFSTCVTAATVGHVVTAIAHTSADGTSEYSQCLPVTDPFTIVNTAALGTGSLFDAVAASNTCAGVDTIRFNIPGAGPHFIAPIQLQTNGPVYIDGYSQPGSSPNSAASDEANNAQIMIELDLFEGQGELPYVRINDAGSTIRGIALTGGSSGDALLILSGTGGHTVEGCRIGVSAAGLMSSSAETGIEIEAGADNNTIGGTAAATQNVIAGADDQNILVASASNIIAGNLIGVLPDGATGAGPTLQGVYLAGAAAQNNRIGGATVAQRNVISNHSGDGVYLLFGSENDIVGNYIGTDVTGASPLPNGGAGVHLISSSDNRVGGLSTDDANLIAFNGGAGARVDSTTGGAPCGAVLVNWIHSNDGLGIDVNGDGVTTNSTSDVWTDHPILASASGDGVSTTIMGDVYGSTPGTYTVHFYDNYACDASGNGEAELYLGSAQVTITSPPSVFFNVTLSQKPLGGYITATATRAGKTSEFSPCVVPIPSSIPDVAQLPAAIALRSIAPNPFNPTTTISFDVPRGGAEVSLVVFDVRGARVRTLLNGPQSPGRKRVTWNGRDHAGTTVSSGVYFARFRAGDYVATKKMILLK